MLSGNVRSHGSSEYHPPPDIISAVTEDPVTGQLYKIYHTLYGSDGGLYCLTDAEKDSYNYDNGWPDIGWTSDPDGACKKCSSTEFTLMVYNSSELCVQNTCPEDGYTLGTYYTTDGCIKCPESYEFTGGTCLWDGFGQPPPWPAPATPEGLAASDGISDLNVRVTWGKSSYFNDYYFLERSSDKANWRELAKVRDTITRYYDKTADPKGQVYYYRVRAYDEDNDQYSAYSNIDSGSKATRQRNPYAAVSAHVSILIKATRRAAEIGN